MPQNKGGSKVTLLGCSGLYYYSYFNQRKKKKEKRKKKKEKRKKKKGCVFLELIFKHFLPCLLIAFPCISLSEGFI
jgi:hypothetical protein